MLAFFQDIPRELEDAAIVDGCSRLRTLWSIVLPIMRPGIAAVSVFVGLSAWNEFPLALVLTSRRARTIPVLINTFVTGRSIEWGTMCAVGTLAVIPMVVFGLLVQKNLIRGLALGAVKN